MKAYVAKGQRAPDELPLVERILPSTVEMYYQQEIEAD
jgi:hypothetical protein